MFYFYIVFISFLILIFIVILYKRCFYKRYDWVTCHYLTDDEGNYVLIYYTDKKKPGILTTKLYHRSPDRNIVDTYIKTLNNYERSHRGKDV